MNVAHIFNISTEEEFNQKAIEVFNFQYQNTLVYQKFVNYLGVPISNINHYSQIPFLPIEFFKTQAIHHKNYSPKKYFQSSGTTSDNLSKHFICEAEMYEKSIINEFVSQIGNPADYVILGLLPSYLEKQNSSLLYMVNLLMKQSNQPENNYFLYNHEDLYGLLNKLSHRKIILFGVSFALLDFVEKYEVNHSNLTVIETGGMKGRKKEITKKEVLLLLEKGFKNAAIYSEYGMTELFSQAYSKGKNIYKTPNWMKILTRELDDPLSISTQKSTGAINIIDLANVYSCSFIATQDLGKQYDNGNFEVLGRIDHSDIRGCSLLLS